MIKPDLIVYVRCNDIELLQRRIKRRARSEEANIDPKFLRQGGDSIIGSGSPGGHHQEVTLPPGGEVKFRT